MTRLMVALSVAATCLVEGALAQNAPAVTVESLRAQHAEYAAKLHRLTVTEVVRVQFLNSEQYQSQLARAAEQRRAAQKRAFLNGRDLASLTPEERAKAEQRFERAHPSDSTNLWDVIWDANTERKVRRQTSYDFDKRRVRMEQTDLRDLSALAQRCGIPENPAQLRSLDQTHTEIDTPSYHLLMYPKWTDAAVQVDRGSPNVALTERLERLGIVPAELLDGKYPTRVTTEADGTLMLRGDWAGSQQAAFEIKLDASALHLMTHEVRYNRKGERVFELSVREPEFADPTGIPFAMASISTRFFPNAGGMQHVERHVVEEQGINPILGDALFIAPAGARLEAGDAAALAAYQAGQKPAAPKP